MKTTYYATYETSNGTRSQITCTNKKRARKEIREIALGNLMQGETASWRVYIKGDNGWEDIYAGRVN